MQTFLKKLTTQKPFTYGIFYLALIPLYAVTFSLLPESNFQLNNHNHGFISCLYFSVITITTLGYGDITPIGLVSQLLTASESIIGIILIGLFLNALSYQHNREIQNRERQIQNKIEKRQSIKKLLAFNQLIELNLKRYITYTIPITTPINKRSNNNINENFSFNDMRDLFEPTSNTTDNHFTPAITYFFHNLKELISTLEELVKLGYVQRWTKLEQLCLDFIETYKRLDYSAYITNQPNTQLENKKGSDFDIETIKNHKGEVKFLPENTINAYVALFQLIHESYNFTKKYRALIIQATASYTSKSNNV